nr:LPXTG cell wall anchor domain-containing protein [Bacillus mobilis]
MKLKALDCLFEATSALTSKAGTLPATGGNMYFTWFSVGAGLLLLTLGAILFMKRRNA